MTINQLIEALDSVPDHLRDNTVLALDDDELELNLARIHILASGAVVLDVRIEKIASRFSEDDIREIQVRRLHESSNNTNSDQPT
jgi:hypothetical protein